MYTNKGTGATGR